MLRPGNDRARFVIRLVLASRLCVGSEQPFQSLVRALEEVTNHWK